MPVTGLSFYISETPELRDRETAVPDGLRVVTGHEGEMAVNLPGELRTRFVDVLDHVAPTPEELPDLLPTYVDVGKRLPKTPAHILLAHYRFAWIRG